MASNEGLVSGGLDRFEFAHCYWDALELAKLQALLFLDRSVLPESGNTDSTAWKCLS